MHFRLLSSRTQTRKQDLWSKLVEVEFHCSLCLEINEKVPESQKAYSFKKAERRVYREYCHLEEVGMTKERFSNEAREHASSLCFIKISGLILKTFFSEHERNLTTTRAYSFIWSQKKITVMIILYLKSKRCKPWYIHCSWKSMSTAVP